MKKLEFILTCFILVSLVGCSQNASPTHTAPGTATPRSSPTGGVPVSPTPSYAPGTVLYKADWSHGLGGWHASQGWSIVQGQLQVNSLPDTTLTVPYMPATSNYAVEVDVQVVKVLKQSDNEFLVVVPSSSHGDGFKGGFESLYQPVYRPSPDFYTGFAQAIANNLNVNAGIQQIDFVPGKRMRTYRIEVSGNQVTLFVDGAEDSTTTSLESAFSNGPIQLQSGGLMLSIGGLRIIAL
jgi:hypothetical protein